MTQRISRRKFVKSSALAGLAATTGLTGCLEGNTSSSKTVKFSHAGSLAVPFNNIETEFEKNNENIKIQRQAHGSVDAVKQVTELGKKIDVVATADYTLIPNMMVPDYTDWFARFARNEYTIAYTEDSKYSDEINSENWYEILQRDGVRFGFSNPNADPCGYRSQMVTQLSEYHYDNENIYENLVGKHTNFEMQETENGHKLVMPKTPNIEVDNKIMIRSKETDLLSALESGQIDYLYLYGSVATQHDYKGVDLPVSVDLSSVDKKDTYHKVAVTLSNGDTVYGKPIVYGITMTSDAPNPDATAKVLKFLLSDSGDQIMSEAGQAPINPAVVNDKSAVPEEIKDLVTEA